MSKPSGYFIYNAARDKFESIDENIIVGMVTDNNKTLRDEFAMAALTGILSHGRGPWDSREAYRVADSMMKARKE